MRFRWSGSPTLAAIMRVTGAVMQVRRPINNGNVFCRSFQKRKPEVAPVNTTCAGSWTGFFICCNQGVSGTCCPKIFRHGKRSIVTSAIGAKMGSGRVFMRRFGKQGKNKGGVTGRLHSKYEKIAKCSTDAALRDIRSLMELKLFAQNEAGGRSTNYRISR